MVDPTKDARPLADFRPSLWGDYFLHHPLPNEATLALKEQEAKEMKEKVRLKIAGVVDYPKERLILIDLMERLGVSYHFEVEIENNLQEIYKKHLNDDDSYNDLHYISLRFRLLRQHGFHVSCEAFENFRDDKGSFKDCLESDVQGLLNLYEASFLMVHGENILEEARAFAISHLTSLAKQLNTPLGKQINHALKHPIHRSTPRLHSRYFISFYQNHPFHDQTLLKFAKLDFDLLQSLHIKELREFIRWSKRMEFTSKAPHARDRDVEGFFWMLGIYYEPKYSFARKICNKFFKLISIVDDTYDAYGTFDELDIFNQAIQRWDKSLMNELPDYMKFIYQSFLDTYEEVEQDLAQKGESYAVYYLQQQQKAMIQSYMQETKWSQEGYIPTYEEYMKNGIVSSGYFYVITSSFQGLEEIATKDAFEWIRQSVKAPRAASVLARILNDMAGHKEEQRRVHVASAVECCVVHEGLTEEEANKKLQQVKEDAWMDINEGILRPFEVPMPLLKLVLNLVRSLHDIYDTEEDGYTDARFIKDKVRAVLIDSTMP